MLHWSGIRGELVRPQEAICWELGERWWRLQACGGPVQYTFLALGKTRRGAVGGTRWTLRIGFLVLTHLQIKVRLIFMKSVGMGMSGLWHIRRWKECVYGKFTRWLGMSIICRKIEFGDLSQILGILWGNILWKVYFLFWHKKPLWLDRSGTVAI